MGVEGKQKLQNVEMAYLPSISSQKLVIKSRRNVFSLLHQLMASWLIEIPKVPENRPE